MSDESKDIRANDGQHHNNDNAHKGVDSAESKKHDELKKQTSKPALEKSASKQKKARAKSSDKITLVRNDKPQRKRKASTRLLEAQEDEEMERNPKNYQEEETKKRRKKRTKKGPVYCLCRKPYSTRSPMIACDTCDEWYHLKCVDMSQEDADALETYKCDRCQRGEPPLRELDGGSGGGDDDQEGGDEDEQDLEEAEPDDEPREAAKRKAPAPRANPAPQPAYGAGYSAYTQAAPPTTGFANAPASGANNSGGGAGDQYYGDGDDDREEPELAGIPSTAVGDIRGGGDDEGELDEDEIGE